MRLLLDTCVSPSIATELTAQGHDVTWVGNCWTRDPGDEEILAFALQEGRIVVTLDKDLANSPWHSVRLTPVSSGSSTFHFQNMPPCASGLSSNTAGI